MQQFNKNHWALILGGSSGFGLATAKKLSRHGMNICIVHRDRRGAMDRIESEFAEIKKTAPQFLSFNLDALSAEGRKTVIEGLQAAMQPSGNIRLLFHSIAFGNLKPIAPLKPCTARENTIEKLSATLGIEPQKFEQALLSLQNEELNELSPLIHSEYSDQLIEEEDMTRTVYSMGTSLLSWTQDLFQHKLFAEDARILGMTSEGNEVAWRGYAAVSAAKVALESIIRSIALEYAPYGIRANAIQAGITDTPALRAIPGSNKMKGNARIRNPFNRLTIPEDVADFVCLMCTDEAAWVNGSLLRIDGGEHIGS
jgi:NAD(P)-dependent dehydrogenase (short-subunit alcohol dehydrogenase family)